MNQNNFPLPNNKQSIDNLEKSILKYWNEKEIFEKTISSRSEKNEFRFFDGPPFATGLPHYGHILAGAIKDMIPRYKTMCGYRVNRKWGWDCHGVPVEFLVEKEHKIGGKPGIEEMGVGKFNELCRDAVMRCANDWEKTVDRMGRFVDFKNDYKTMDPEFMESVWWVFKSLWDKGLIYEGEKVIPYSPKLGSPLSNFEANQNYQIIDDQTATVKFELVDEPNTYFLAWTTTPWTLPSNLALCVNPDLDYVKIEFKNHREQTTEYIIVNEKYRDLAIGHFEDSCQRQPEGSIASASIGGVKCAKVVEEFKGSKLKGKQYKPLFPFFENKENNYHQVLEDDFVSDSDGTGIVHLAPNFGEEDARVCAKDPNNIIKYLDPNPIDENGYFSFEPEILEKYPEAKLLNEKYFRKDAEVHESLKENANSIVLQILREKNLIFDEKSVSHDYPFCWRTDCALMYRGIKTWFVNVRKIKETMIEQNQNINWLPEHLKDGRFGKILETAPDWAISRNRFWGTPIPVWRCVECDEIEVMGSQADLENKTGGEVKDLHKHFVDDMTWECAKCKGKMERIPEVLDCWFESGSMPYASVHYPFAKNAEGKLEETLQDFQPADFIAEGIDQTRGWFYTLHVLGCALFGKNIFKNVITNGIVLAEDGQKMSKSKKNYPDPNLIFEKYGADSMRFYMLSSPVVKAENFRFAEQGVSEVLKSVILPLKSTYNFFSTYANIDNWKPTKFAFVRHGEGDHNVQSIYSGEIENEHHLTVKGKEQVTATAKFLPSFDILMASPFVRTQETAQLVKDVTGFSGKIETDNRVKEINFGDFEGRKITDIYRQTAERIEKKTGEMPMDIKVRVADFLEDVTKKFAGKMVCVASHGGSIRTAEAVLMNVDVNNRDEYNKLIQAEVGQARILYANPNPQTELDRWILSELQVLLKNFRDHMDHYRISVACAEIPPFVDKLNNWFLRRSRERFWAAGVTVEKTSGYETLFHVLLTLSKILAPICPFFAEKLYQDLTGSADAKITQSVHLEFLPFANEELIDEITSQKIAVMREIVSLAAGIRARKKIKLRQPLPKLSFSLSSALGKEVLDSLQDEDLEIIKQEANVKNLEVMSAEEVGKFAQRIVKVDARKLGPKFGKKVQEIIVAGKKGEFTENGDGTVTVAGETLQADEFNFSFVCSGDYEADSTDRVVTLLDVEISEELRLEGLAREIIRAIQEKRKADDFEISDRIVVKYFTDSEDLKAAFVTCQENIVKEVLANSVDELSEAQGQEFEIEGGKLYLELVVDK